MDTSNTLKMQGCSVGIMSEVRLSTVGQYQTAVEAHIVAGRLRSAGIAAEVVDEHFVSMNWLYSQAIGGVRVQVPDFELEDARKVLAEEVSQEDMPGAIDAGPRCPRCGSVETDYFRKSIGVAVSWLLLGLPLLLPKGYRRCQNCRHSWNV